MPTDVSALIDRIAAALGPEATVERVERVARAVLDARPSSRSSTPPSPTTPGARVIVTAYGNDTPGVLAGLTAELSAAGANILDVSQKILQGYFTVVLVADLPGSTDIGSLRDRLNERGETFGARVLIQHEDLFQAMHRP